MKKLFRQAHICALAVILFLFSGASAAAQETSGTLGPFAKASVSTTSQAYVVMDADTGQVLAAKNAEKRMYPASITKVMTAALTLMEHKPEERFTVGTEVNDILPGSSMAPLYPGEEVSVEDLLYAIMLPSANDAANALAVYTDGSVEEFAGRMNEKAAQLGAAETHFVNPSGLPDNNHYTTALDFARITAWALDVPDFVTYFGAAEYTMAPSDKQPEERVWGTYDCLTVESSFTYKGAIGGKTGYTEEAEHTYVSAAERDGMRLVLVDLKTSQKYDKFKNAVALYDYCFETFQRTSYSVSASEQPEEIPYYRDGVQEGNVRIVIPRSVEVTIPKGRSTDEIGAELVDVPERYESGEEIAPELRLTLDGEELLRVPLSYEMETIRTEDKKTEETKEKTSVFGIILRVLLGLLAIPVIFFLVLVILRIFFKVRRRIRRRRRERMRAGR